MAKKNTFKIIIAITAVAAVIVAIAAILVFKNNADEHARNGNITTFSFSRGYGLGGAMGYTLARQGDKAEFKLEKFGESSADDEKITKMIDAKYLDELAAIIKEKDLVRWDGFDKSRDGVLDGSGFTLRVIYDDGKKIDAHGYMAYPEDYNEVEEALDAFFDKLREE